MGKKKKSGPTEEEKELANAAQKEYNLAQELSYVKEEYSKRIDQLGSDEMQSSVAGLANINGQNSMDSLYQDQALQMSRSGIDPSSGRGVGVATALTEASGDAIGSAQSQAQFALDTSHLGGMANRVAMAQGQGTTAIGGLQDIAGAARQQANERADSKFNERAALMYGLGSIAGAGGKAYADSKDK